MLALTRRLFEKIRIGDDIIIELADVSEDGQSVTLEITAPDAGIIHTGKSVDVYPRHQGPVITVKRRSHMIAIARAKAEEAKK